MSSGAQSKSDVYEAVFGALAHPARRRVLLTLYFNDGSMTAGNIAGIFAHAWQTTTRHLRVLEKAGLLSHQKRGRTRIYRLQQKRLQLVRDWLDHFSEQAKTKESDYGSKKAKQDPKADRNQNAKGRSATLPSQPRGWRA